MDFAGAQHFILKKLKNELGNHLTYHSLLHTLDVHKVTLWHIAEHELDLEDSILVQTAALYHDSGFTIEYTNHEERGCEIAKQYLPNFGYNSDQIEKICGMIMATKIPQDPQNLLEEIVCDSDLDYLGRNDFEPIAKTLFSEFKNQGIVQDEESWNRLQIDFLESHQYFTNLALIERRNFKDNRLQQIRDQLNGVEPTPNKLG